LAILTIVICSLAGASASQALGDDISVVATVDRNSVWLGETFTYTVEVSGVQTGVRVKLPAMDAFRVAFGPSQGTQVSLVNGVVSMKSTASYTLLTVKAGSFRIDPATVTVGRRQYTTNAVAVTVRDAGGIRAGGTGRAQPQKGIYVTVETDKIEAYVNEQVILLFRLFVASQVTLAPPVRYIQPTLEGFLSEPLDTRDGYDTIINGVPYRVLELATALFPVRPGELTIVGAGAEGNVRVSRTLFGRTQRFTLTAEPTTLTVKPLPEPGKPASFTGSVGQFKLSVNKVPEEVEVGAPITLTAKISGSGSISGIGDPVLPEVEDVKRYELDPNQKITSRRDGLQGEKSFEIVLRPQKEGTLVIPKLEFTYFDTEQESYRTLARGPFELNVIPAANATAMRVVSFDTAAGKRGIQVVGEDIFTIYSTPGRLSSSETLSAPAWVVLLTAPPCAHLLVLLAVRRKYRLKTDVRYVRHLNALRTARATLKAAARTCRSGRTGEACPGIAGAISNYLSDKLNLAPGALTSEETVEKLEAAGAAPELISEVVAILDQCDAARYAGAGEEPVGTAQLVKRTESLLSRLERVFGKMR